MKKSAARRANDQAKKNKLGGKLPNATAIRGNVARAWFELKRTHEKSEKRFQDVAIHLMKYNNPLASLRITRNGEIDQFHAGIKKVGELATIFGARLLALLALHEHKKHLCTGQADMISANQAFEGYRDFDMDIYTTFSPLITELNAIFNRALKDLETSKALANTKALEDAQKTPLDVDFKEVQPATAN